MLFLIAGLGLIVAGFFGYRLCRSAATRLTAGGQSATGLFHIGRAFADRRTFAGVLVALLGQLSALLALVGGVIVLIGIALLVAG